VAQPGHDVNLILELLQQQQQQQWQQQLWQPLTSSGSSSR
jgi:hypothetical protein